MEHPLTTVHRFAHNEPMNFPLSLTPQFTEHVGRNYQPNYLTAWRKSALIFMTHSYWGGWHHVEVHEDPWWIMRMTAMGFVYSELLTNQMRGMGAWDKELIITNPRNESDQQIYNTGQHVGSLLVRCLSAFSFALYFYHIMELNAPNNALGNCTSRLLSILTLHLGQSTPICLPRYDFQFTFLVSPRAPFLPTTTVSCVLVRRNIKEWLFQWRFKKSSGVWKGWWFGDTPPGELQTLENDEGDGRSMDRIVS